MLDILVQEMASLDCYAILRGVLPCQVIVLIGYLFGRHDRASYDKTLSGLIYFVFSPCLVFTGIHRHSFSYADLTALSLASILSVLFLISPATSFCRFVNRERDDVHAMPLVFSSTGTFLMPIAYMLYGSEGLAKAAAYHMFSSLIFFTYGMRILEGSMQAWRFFRSPSFIAVVIAVLCSEYKFSLPVELKEIGYFGEHSLSIIAFGAIPFLLFSYGYPFCRVDGRVLLRALPEGMFRMIAGPLSSFLVVLLLRHFGLLSMAKGYNVLDYIDMRTTEALIILAGIIPGSMSSYMACLRSDSPHSNELLAILLASCLVGIVSIPVSLLLVNRFILLS